MYEVIHESPLLPLFALRTQGPLKWVLNRLLHRATLLPNENQLPTLYSGSFIQKYDQYEPWTNVA